MQIPANTSIPAAITREVVLGRHRCHNNTDPEVDKIALRLEPSRMPIQAELAESGSKSLYASQLMHSVAEGEGEMLHACRWKDKSEYEIREESSLLP